MALAPLRILITGGTGYLGQFLIRDFALEPGPKKFKVWYTSSKGDALPNLPASIRHVRADFSEAEGVAQFMAAVRELRPHVVVHTAAMASPGACEKAPEVAMKINAPQGLLDALLAMSTQPDAEGGSWQRPLLIALSTDMVFSGSKEQHDQYRETDAPQPVNVYGQSKVAMEELLLNGMSGTTGACEQSDRETRLYYDLVILRSSNILGPPAPLAAIKGTKFTQWLAASLADVQRTGLSDSVGTGDQSINAADYKPLTLFHDEYRSYVYVGDIVRVVAALIQMRETSADADAFRRSVPQVLNMGGPDALNRVQVAHEVAAALGTRLTCSVRAEAGEEAQVITVEKPKIIPTSRTSVDLGYPSPLNIAMDSSFLMQSLGLPMTNINVALRRALN
mmetsp:Transcript_7020/g.13007  ORF Transcript_7020/g.13007 Transcript_7020/m.13007 type:complete len:393 (+) Transcript_7020:28-1206(+)